MKEFKNLCTPAKIYLVVTLFLCVMSLMNDAPVLAVALKVVFAVIWTCILSWLCKKGLSAISWILILLPFIVIFLGMLGITHMANKERRHHGHHRHLRHFRREQE